MNYKDIFKKWKGFGWNTILCEGHDIVKILKALKSEKKCTYCYNSQNS